MYEISAMVFGVYPAEDGFERVRIAPVTLPDGFRGRCRVPVPRGYIDVEAERCGKEMKLSVKASRKMAMEIKLPGCEPVSVFDNQYFAQAEVNI